VVLNKADLVGGDTKPWEDALKKAKVKVFATVSAATHLNTDELVKKLLPIVLEEKEKREALPETEEKKKEIPVIRPHLSSEKKGAFSIDRKNGRIVIKGQRIEQFASMTNFANPGGRQRFIDVLDRVGVLKALEKIAEPDDTVFIGLTRVDEYLK
jgi:Obg family GTPase CgtA-like protein